MVTWHVALVHVGSPHAREKSPTSPPLDLTSRFLFSQSPKPVLQQKSWYRLRHQLVLQGLDSSSYFALAVTSEFNSQSLKGRLRHSLRNKIRNRIKKQSEQPFGWLFSMNCEQSIKSIPRENLLPTCASSDSLVHYGEENSLIFILTFPQIPRRRFPQQES